MIEFRVLIVEDSAEKAQELSRIVNDELHQIGDVVVVVPDVVSAKRALMDTHFAALILDIQIPLRFGDPVRVDGGTRLLEEIRAGSTLKRPSQIVGVTQYENSYAGSIQTFKASLAGLILYAQSNSSWESELRSFLRQARYSFELQSTQSSHANVDMVIVCALNDPEMRALISDENDWVPVKSALDCISLYETTLPTTRGSRRIVAACALEMGMAASAALAGMLIERYKPRFIAMCGIAGGVKGEVEIGDIVVANVVWDYSSGKLQSESRKTVFQPEPKVLPLDPFQKNQFTLFMASSEVTARIRNAWKDKRPDHDLTVHLGPMFTGASVVAAQDKVDELTSSHRKLKAIEMEAYAIFCAAEYASAPKPIAIVVKSISDLADVAKDDAWRKYAAHTSSRYLIEWARQYL